LFAISFAAIFFSIITKAKTPVFFFIFMIFVYAMKSSKKSGKSLSFKLVAVGSIPLILSIFNKLQSIKQSEYVNGIESGVSRKYLGGVGNIYGLLKRMDLLRAQTDAILAGPHSWYNFPNYAYMAIKSLIWNYGNSSLVFGQEWGVRLLGANSASTVTALSVNYVAEGWVLSGYLGIVFVSILMAILSSLVFRIGQLGIYGLFFLLSVIASNTLFENGAMQLLQNITKSTKETIIFAILFLPLQTFSKQVSIVRKSF
jgi:hypothetical protein